LYAAPLALVMYAMFGGSKLLMFGAAGSVAAVSASVVGDLSGGDKDTAVAMTAGLALAAGAVFVVAGLAKMGWITNFISKAVMSGFIVGLSIQNGRSVPGRRHVRATGALRVPGRDRHGAESLLSCGCSQSGSPHRLRDDPREPPDQTPQGRKGQAACAIFLRSVSMRWPQAVFSS
jgi:hypothetical protein